MIRFFTLLGLASFLLIPLSTSWCYYLDSNNNPLLLRKDAPSETVRTTYTIQDNLSLFSQPDRSSPVLLPASNYFIAADTIDSNLPIFSLFRNPDNLTLDPFANFLYANLRTKKLLQEYAEIQLKARTLLGSSYQSGTIDTMTANSTYLQKRNHTGYNNLSKDTLAGNLKKLQQHLAGVGTTRSTGTYRARGYQTNTPGDRYPITSFHSLQQILTQKDSAAASTTHRTQGGYAPTGYLGYRPQNNASQDQSYKYNADKPTYTDREETTLSRLLNLFFNFFQYLFSHIYLSMGIGFFGLLVLKLLFGSRQ